MTYIIIGEPIGAKMFWQIVLAIIFVLPIIGLISYYFGKFLSNKFNFIQNRLKNIKDENFTQDISINKIKEINDINNHINFLSNKLDSLISDLKQKNQNLSDLLISMAHDIKTPITILNGNIEEIEDGIVDKKDIPKVLENMKNEVKFLDEITVDMLEFISSMQTHKSKEDINLYNFINKEVFTILPKKENLLYINNIHEDFIIKFNKVDLKKICLNIFTNSIKYTNNGYIKIEIKDNIISFENNGKRIDEKYKDKIFEPFFTISKSKNRKESGFGLGLCIVKNLSLNNGYKCYLKSSDDKKTVFYLDK